MPFTTFRAIARAVIRPPMIVASNLTSLALRHSSAHTRSLMIGRAVTTTLSPSVKFHEITAFAVDLVPTSPLSLS